MNVQQKVTALCLFGHLFYTAELPNVQVATIISYLLLIELYAVKASNIGNVEANLHRDQRISLSRTKTEAPRRVSESVAFSTMLISDWSTESVLALPVSLHALDCSVPSLSFW